MKSVAYVAFVGWAKRSVPNIVAHSLGALRFAQLT
jgi:hypothetical protein